MILSLLITPAFATLTAEDVSTARRLLYTSGYTCGQTRGYLQTVEGYSCTGLLPTLPSQICLTRLTSGCTPVDMDADGSNVADDCDDTDPTVYPSAPEVCDNGIDENCSGADDPCHPTELDATSSTAHLYGSSWFTWFGGVIANAGDTDGNGTDDLLVGAPYWTPSSTERGAAFLYDNVSGSIAATGATAILYGNNGGDRLGDAMAPAGDLNGDGFGDLLIAAPGIESGAGVDMTGDVFVVYGPVSGTRNLTTNYDQKIAGLGRQMYFGTDVTPIGDQDGDGADDWCASAAYDVYCFSSADTADGNVHDAIGDIHLTDTPYPGQTLAEVGDYDGDGVDDIVMGSYVNSIYVYAGPITGTFDASDALFEVAAHNAHWRVDPVGDINDDGLADFGANADGVGMAVWLGGTTGSAVDAGAPYAFGYGAGEGYAMAVDAGDVNDDGVTDLVFGSPYDSSHTSYGGATRLLYGPFAAGNHTWDEADLTLWGNGVQSGWDVELGDYDGDGRLDIASSTYYGEADTTGAAGAVWVWSGASF